MVLCIVGKFINLYCDPNVILFHIRDVWQRSNRTKSESILHHLCSCCHKHHFFCLAISLRYHLFVHIIIPFPAFSSFYFSFLSSFFMASWLSAVFHTLYGQVIPNKWCSVLITSSFLSPFYSSLAITFLPLFSMSFSSFSCCLPSPSSELTSTGSLFLILMSSFEKLSILLTYICLSGDTETK